MSLNFPIVANNTVPVQFQVFNPPPDQFTPSTPVNITGFTIKWQAFDSTGKAKITKLSSNGGITLTNPSQGIFTVNIFATDTITLTPGAYTHEAVTVDGGGNPVTVVNNDPLISAGVMTLRKQYTVQS